MGVHLKLSMIQLTITFFWLRQKPKESRCCLCVRASVRVGYYAQKGSRRVLEGAKGGNLRGNSRGTLREHKWRLKRGN